MRRPNELGDLLFEFICSESCDWFFGVLGTLIAIAMWLGAIYYGWEHIWELQQRWGVETAGNLCLGVTTFGWAFPFFVGVIHASDDR